MKQLRHQGKYYIKPFSRSTFAGIRLLLATVAIGAFINWLYAPVELHRPITGEVMAVEPKPSVETIVLPPITQKQRILNYIVEKFGDDADKLITIIGTCENGTWDQSRTNTNRNGTIDWGLAQINDANSKLCKGLDFQNSWKDNLDCAKIIKDSQGLQAWTCSDRVGVVPFYKRNK